MVVCDYLSLTVPVETAPSFRSETLAFFASVGIEASRTEGVYFAPDGGGTAKVQNRGPVLALSFSGGLLSYLRGMDAMRELLSLLCTVSHRVTRLDACLDVREDAPPHLANVFRLALDGKIRLGQRPVPSRSIGHLERVALYEPHPLTGSVYVGLRGDDRRLLVYDKRNERMDAGLGDPGPWVRYEVTVGKGGRSGVSLRDVEDPAPLFWSVMGSQVLPRPADVAVWAPSGVGFTLPPVVPVPPYERLTLAADRSEGLAALCRLAVGCGPTPGPDEPDPRLAALLRAVRHAYGLALNGGPASTV